MQEDAGARAHEGGTGAAAVDAGATEAGAGASAAAGSSAAGSGAEQDASAGASAGSTAPHPCGGDGSEDACADDRDCGEGARCACNARDSLACVRAECLSDDGCGAGLLCRRTYACDLPVGSFHCGTAQDECQSTDDCERGVCHFSRAEVRWVCALLPPCTS